MPSIFRYILSFFREEVLETTQSATHGTLEVWYAWGKVVVNSSRVNMSFGALDKVFRAAFRKEKVLDRPWKDVLLLGLGAGNVPQILESRPGKFQVTGVEIDPEMLRLAHQWCGLGKIKGLEIVQGDAIRFVSDCASAFDLVVVDLFQDREVPTAAETPAFLMDLAKILRPGGMLMFNRLMHDADLAEQTETFTRKMEQVLPGSRHIRAHTNRMLIYEKK